MISVASVSKNLMIILKPVKKKQQIIILTLSKWQNMKQKLVVNKYKNPVTIAMEFFITQL